VKALGSLLQVSPVGFRPSQERQLGASDRTSRTATPACISAAIRATVAFPVPTGRAAFPMRVPARREARTAASRSADRFGARTPADRARLSLADVSLTGKRIGLTLGLEFLLAVQASCAGQRRDCLPSALFRSLSPALRHPKHGGLLWPTCSGAQHLKD